MTVTPSSPSASSASAPSTPPHDAVPEVLWQPGRLRIERAAITDFAAFVAERAGREFADYAELWEFSVDDLETFWQAVADYFAVRWHDEPNDVIDRRVMPGADLVLPAAP